MKRIVPILIVLLLAAGGYWWANQPTAAALGVSPAETPLTGSGSIEAETIALTAELGGRVLDVTVAEGEVVTAGQRLVELDQTDLLAQKMRLETTLATARANLDLVTAAARPADVAMAQAQLAQARAARDGARSTWAHIAAMRNDPHDLTFKINQAEAQVAEAERNLERAQVQLKRAEIRAEAAGRNQSDHAALVENEAAQKQLEAARVGVRMAEAGLQGAQTQLEHLIRWRDNPLQLIAQVNAAQAAYDQAEAGILAAEANLAAVKARPMPEDVTVAQAQVAEVQAALDAVAVQLAKQTLTAPRDGVVSRRLVEPGELAQPGRVLLELRDLETVDLVVYIPETQIGRVSLGQPAQVYVDAYEAEVFSGTVSYIAPEAEFTPKNVQTREERVNLVFAVKITLANTERYLKPGMPADAVIGSEVIPRDQPNAQDNSSPTPSPQPTLVPTTTPTPTPTKMAAEPTARPLEPAPAIQARILTGKLNVRRQPGVASPILTTLDKDQTAPVLETDPSSGWLRVQLPSGRTGWVSGHPLYVAIEEITEQPAPEIELAPPTQAEIISSGLNVRQGPGTGYPVIASLSQGYTMPVIEVDARTGWLQVALPGYDQTGWISGDPAFVRFK